LSPRSTEADLAEAKRWLGLPLDERSLIESLRKMRFDVSSGARSEGRGARNTKNTDSLLAPRSSPLLVSYPPYRTDIRHPVDLLEDVAIGYGYGNIEPRLVRSMTVGTPRPEESLSDRVRQILIGLGYSEIMSLPLTTEEHQFERLRTPTPERYPQITNPKLKAYNVVRTHLMGGLFEALRENRRRPMPQRLFEIDNVVELDDSAETGAVELRRLALTEAGRESGYASARGVMDALLRELGWEAQYAPVDHPTFVPGRAAMLSRGGKNVGFLGEVHPEVLTNFGLTYPVALAELTLQRVF
jgi:phenylalanyl-tRNA synthetase beta chain